MGPYLWDGEPTGKPGRPRVKGEKIDFKNIDKSKVAILDTDKSNEQVYALKAWCKSLHRKFSSLTERPSVFRFAIRVVVLSGGLV